MVRPANRNFDRDDEPEFESTVRRGHKRLLLPAVVIALVLGASATAYFTGLLKPLLSLASGRELAETTVAERKKDNQNVAVDEVVPNAVFYDLPEMLVNINTTGRLRHFLKLAVTVELGTENDVPKIENVLPRIVDNFQLYLRGLTLKDLQGSAGTFRIREELLTRINAAVRPTQIKDVLLKEMIVQ